MWRYGTASVQNGPGCDGTRDRAATTMTASKPTPETGEKITDESCAGADETTHDITGGGPAGRFSIEHTGDVDIEVFTTGKVWLAVESQETASASSGVGVKPEQARQLAEQLRQAADEIDETTDD
jgi:hypothetical protein